MSGHRTTPDDDAPTYDDEPHGTIVRLPRDDVEDDDIEQ